MTTPFDAGASQIHEGRSLAEGRYVLRSPLGQGAMGQVWRAHDLRLSRDVALKIVLATGDREAHERLRDEARAAARLSHPALVAVYDHGEAAGLGPWIVSELLPGRSLGDELDERGSLSCEGVRGQLVPDLLGALEALHGAGIVHRDVKPANVLRVHGGGYKLGDFGLALFRGREARTATGLFMGTPAYLAPEQVAGGSRSVGASADVYAVSLLFVQALCGRLPFEERETMGLLRERLEVELDELRLRRFGLDSAWAAALAPALRSDPRERLGQVAELRRRIDAMGEPSTATVTLHGPPTPSPEGRRNGARTDRPAPRVPIEASAGRAPKSTRRLVVTLGLLLAAGILIRLLSSPGDPLPPKRPPVGGAGNHALLEGILARSPLLDEPTAADLRQMLDMAGGAGTVDAKRARLRRQEEIALARTGVYCPAYVLLRSRRMDADGEGDPKSRLRSLFRSMIFCFDRQAEALAKEGQVPSFAAVTLLGEELLRIASAHGQDEGVRSLCEQGLWDCLEGLSFLPFPARGEEQALAAERLLIELHALIIRWSWREALPELVKKEWIPFSTRDALRARLRQAQVDCAHGLHRLEVCCSTAREALALSDMKDLKDAAEEFDTELTRVCLAWWRIRCLLGRGLGLQGHLGALRTFLSFGQTLTQEDMRRHVAERPGLHPRYSPFGLAPMAFCGQRAFLTFFRRVYDPSRTDRTELEVLEERDMVFEAMERLLPMLDELHGPSFPRRWARLDQALGKGPHGPALDSARVRGLDRAGKRPQAMALAERCYELFAARCAPRDDDLERLALDADMMRRNAFFLLRPEVVPMRPEASATLIARLREFCRSWRREPSFRRLKTFTQRVETRCRIAEKVLRRLGESSGERPLSDDAP